MFRLCGVTPRLSRVPHCGARVFSAYYAGKLAQYQDALTRRSAILWLPGTAVHLSLGQTADVIADAILAGDADAAAIAERVTALLGKQGRWLPALADKVVRRFGSRWADTDREALSYFVAVSEDFVHVWDSDARPVLIRFVRREPKQRSPQGALSRLILPQIPTCGDLAAWLDITPGQLDWFADRWHFSSRDETTPLHHYVYQWIEKRDGRSRLIEIPKSRLRALQRRVLHGLLARVPPHDAAHGFRQGRNIVSYASPHADSPVVIRLDLADFFTSVSAGRVFRLFRTLGYPSGAARALTALCTNRVPDSYLLKEFLRQGINGRLSWQERQRYRTRHLPQGAPTSPALANLCAYRLDARLSALARSLGAVYTRYADDLAFSGGEVLPRLGGRFCIQVAAIALEEGFAVQHRKTRIMRRNVRQHLAGVVVNRHPNMARGEFDRLKAILTNCVRHGPASQNRDAHRNFQGHLAGCVAQATLLNPARGGKLREIFDRIRWDKA